MIYKLRWFSTSYKIWPSITQLFYFLVFAVLVGERNIQKASLHATVTRKYFRINVDTLFFGQFLRCRVFWFESQLSLIRVTKLLWKERKAVSKCWENTSVNERASWLWNSLFDIMLVFYWFMNWGQTTWQWIRKLNCLDFSAIFLASVQWSSEKI